MVSRLRKPSPPRADKEKNRGAEQALAHAATNPEAHAQLLLHLKGHHSYETSHESTCVPPGSLLSDVLRGFYQGTNIPLGLPFSIFLTFLSGLLCKQGIKLKAPDGSVITPDIWTIVLGASGCGKTWTIDQLRSLFPDCGEIPLGGAVSAPAFLRILSQQSKGVWLEDEWAQYQREIEKPSSPLAPVRSVLLQIYGGATMRRERVSGEQITIENPCIAICGLTVDKTYREICSIESMLDGFAARFGFIFAEPDPQRPFQKYPWWSVPKDEWPRRWHEIGANIQSEYSIQPAAHQYYREAFSDIYGQLASEMPEAFFRRVMHRWHKLAWLMHIIAGKPSPEIDKADYEVAARTISRQLTDGAKLIDQLTGGELRTMLEDATKWRQRHPNTPLTRRNLIAGVRSIQTAQAAEFVLRVLLEEPQPQNQAQTAHISAIP
jgi:hypothetical protein